MVCGTLGKRGRVLLENILPLPVQATMHFGGHCDELVYPPLARNGGAEMWLRQAEMICGNVLTSPLSYEEGSEMGCGEMGWRRMTQTHQTSNTTEPSSLVWNNLGAMDTQPHTTHHYIPQLLNTCNTPSTAKGGAKCLYEPHKPHWTRIILLHEHTFFVLFNVLRALPTCCIIINCPTPKQ